MSELQYGVSNVKTITVDQFKAMGDWILVELEHRKGLSHMMTALKEDSAVWEDLRLSIGFKAWTACGLQGLIK